MDLALHDGYLSHLHALGEPNTANYRLVLTRPSSPPGIADQMGKQEIDGTPEVRSADR